MTDFGTGIKRAAMSRIFEPFYTSDDAQGSGLGLAIAHELAERMDGRAARRERARPDDVLAGAPGMRRRTLAAGTAAAALLAAGCGGKQETRTISAQTTTTRVEILKDAGDASRAAGRSTRRRSTSASRRAS